MTDAIYQHDNGLEIKGNPPYGVFEDMARVLSTVHRQTPVQTGDLLNEVEQRFGEDNCLQLMTLWPDKLQQTLANYKSICKNVIKSVRPHGCRIGQLDAVRTLPPEKQKEILFLAVEKDWGYEEIRQEYSELLPQMVKRTLTVQLPGDFQSCYRLALDILEKMLGFVGGVKKARIEEAIETLREVEK